MYILRSGYLFRRLTKLVPGAMVDGISPYLCAIRMGDSVAVSRLIERIKYVFIITADSVGLVIL